MEFSNKEILEKYKAGNVFNCKIGGKMDNVFVCLKNRKYPKDEEGYSGLFHKTKQGLPLFTRIKEGEIIATFNLQYYVPIDVYDEPIMF